MYWLCYHIHTYKKTLVRFYVLIWRTCGIKIFISTPQMCITLTIANGLLLWLTDFASPWNFNGRWRSVDGSNEVLSCHREDCECLLVILNATMHRCWYLLKRLWFYLVYLEQILLFFMMLLLGFCNSRSKYWISYWLQFLIHPFPSPWAFR